LAKAPTLNVPEPPEACRNEVGVVPL
jgi:hypothetical protein